MKGAQHGNNFYRDWHLYRVPNPGTRKRMKCINAKIVESHTPMIRSHCVGKAYVLRVGLSKQIRISQKALSCYIAGPWTGRNYHMEQAIMYRLFLGVIESQ